MPLDYDVVSNVLGWISIACWIVVYSPQIWENYQLKSGEGLSIFFVYVWLLGDLCNVTGAVVAQLLPTVIIIGVYYTLCDATLLFQVHYYRWRRRTRRILSNDATESDPSERSCLLGDGEDAVGEQQSPAILQVAVRYMAAVVFVIVIGVAAYLISERIHSRGVLTTFDDGYLELEVQIIGWTSAVCYIVARVPQIYKNIKTRCEGLAPGLFFFAILGNTTYALSICIASTDHDYLIRNASWLAGSTVTVLLDIIVLNQFFYYGYLSRQRGT